jgi:localization factor PodJL
MSSYGSWSVKGIDDRARAAAKDKARREGVTLGDYINGLLLKGHSEAGPRDVPDADVSQAPHKQPENTALDGIARRIEAVEARSTLAITGIDQSVLGLLARIENTDNASSAMAAEVEAMIDELRETHEALQGRIQRIEGDDTAQENLQAMKALEQALGKLASHVYEESNLQQDETSAIKGRMESGFGDLGERVEGMEVKVETTLAEAAKRVEDAVAQAELRAEGSSRHLSERFTAVETGVAAKLAKVGDVDARVSAVEGDVSSAITSMEGTMVRIQERLNRAETTTDTALKALEQTFASLDDRIEKVAEHANPERAEALRRQFEERFEGLAAELRASIEETRMQLADEIEQAAAGENPEFMGRLETTIDGLKQRLNIGEERSSRALEAVSSQVNRIATGLDKRIRNVEAQDTGAVVEAVRAEVSKTTEVLVTRLDAVESREDRIVTEITDQMGSLADQLDKRVTESESRSAAAIEQVGEQVAGAINRVQARQESIATETEDKIAALGKRQDARLSGALNKVSERLASMQSQTVSVVSPVQKAIASLAARIESIEDFNAPPHSRAKTPALPDMPVMRAAPQVAFEDGEEFVAFTDAPLSDDQDTDLMAELPVDDVEPDTTIAEDDDWMAEGADEDYTSAQTEPEHNYLTDIPNDDINDPLAELSGGIDEDAPFEAWDGDRHEARESDVFGAPDDIDDSFELAGNVPQLARDTIDTSPEPVLQVDQDATDYLARARRAAIAAAEDSGTKKQKGRRSAASTTPKKAKKVKMKAASGSKGSSKLPIIATASVIALAAAGAGGYIALRGTQDTAPIEVATASSLGLETTNEAGLQSDAGDVSLDGIVFEDTNAGVDAELFEDEGSAMPAEEAVFATTATVTAESPTPLNLPTVPKRLTLERAAMEGTPIAQYQWGEARLAAQDYTAGPDFVRRAAQQGLPAAQYRLAKLHEQGLGVPRDMNEARAWTEKAARGGNVKAMHDLAVFFADGEGGAQSYAGAVEWFRKAADFGVVDSQYNLAVLYENGLGISLNRPEALYWYEIAAKNGDVSAPGNVDQLREQMTLEEAQTAQRRAANWTRITQNAAANGSFSAQAWQNGSREQTLAVQAVLNGLGYDAGTPDGIAGAGTRTALRTFQSDSGLPTSGEIDDATVDALNNAAAKA